MAAHMDHQWQIGKSLVECHRYKLEKEIDCDVVFEISTPEPVLIRAHKYMLTARSPVFEAMFSGNFQETNQVPITDIEAGAFKEMLRYIYTDEADLCADNALQVLAAANKYILEGLETLCTEYLNKVLEISNACTLLDQSNLFMAEDLKQRCLELITNETQAVMVTEGFLKLSQDSLLDILKINNLAIENESVAYYACMAWAKQNVPSGQGCSSRKELRRVLGTCLHNIRFGSMSPDEFAQTGAKSGILTPQDVASFFCYILRKDSKVQLEQTGYNLQERSWQWICHLFEPSDIIPTDIDLPSNVQNHNVHFSVDKDVKVSGFTMFTCDVNQSYNILMIMNVQNQGRHTAGGHPQFTMSPMQVNQPQQKVRTNKQVRGIDNNQHVTLHLDEPFLLKPGYTCRITIKNRNGVVPLFTGTAQRNRITSRNVKFRFHYFQQNERQNSLISGVLMERA